jgi:hypothetical protein
MMRRLLTQCAWAAVKVKGSIFEQKFRTLLARLGAKPAIWAVAHRLLRVIWKVLHARCPISNTECWTRKLWNAVANVMFATFESLASPSL